MARPLLMLVALLVLSSGATATPLLAAGGKDEGAALGALALIPALLLLVAMPLALFVASSAPGLVERAAALRSRRPMLTFLIGLSDTVGLLAIGAALAAVHPALGIVTLLLAAALLAIAVIGLVGTARDLGDRLLTLGDRPASPLRKLCWGWLLLAGIPLLPVLGALVLLYLAPGAIGAGHLAFHGSRDRSASRS